MEKSTHKVEIVPVVLEKHPDADKLSVVKVWDYTVCVQTAGWLDRSLGAYIPPDSLVDTGRPEFAFLKEDGKPPHHRVKARRLRGIWSQGLLIPAPEGSKVGDDVTELLGVLHYVPPESGTGSNADEETPPAFQGQGAAPTYDVDSGYKYGGIFIEGEEVLVEEKLHGSNCRFLYSSKDQEFHIGSRNRWIKDDKQNMWSQAVDQNPWLKTWCMANPDIVVYAEVVGAQDLKYGLPRGHYRLYVFDLMKDGRFIDHLEAYELGKDLVWVPLVYRGPFQQSLMKELCLGQSLVNGAGNIREGVVCKPVKERWDMQIGRVCLKWVSPDYLSRAK